MHTKKPTYLFHFDALTGECDNFDFSNLKICFGCGSGGGGQNTTSTVTNSAPPQYVQDAYQALLARGNQVAAAPFSQLPQPVAGLQPDQTSAINTINQAQGIATPFANAGAQYAAAGAAPVYGNLPEFNAQNIQKYMDPNTQNVIDATQKQLNQNDAVQQQQLLGKAISSGASPFGGDRAGVAAAALSGQQDLANNQTIAGLYSQNYTQALNEFNNQQQNQANVQASDAWRQLSAGQLLPQIGTQAQSNILSGASAQLQGGGIEQQLAQEQLNSPYQNYLAQLAYPFQTANFLGGLTEGVGSGSGGTATGTTATPGPSSGSQLAGLGLTGLALNQSLPAGYGMGALLGLVKHGGRIQHKATGGGIAVPQIGENNQISYISAPSSQGGIGGTPVSGPSGGIATPQINMQPKPQGGIASTIPSNLMQNYAPGVGGGSSYAPPPSIPAVAAPVTQSNNSQLNSAVAQNAGLSPAPSSSSGVVKAPADARWGQEFAPAGYTTINSGNGWFYVPSYEAPSLQGASYEELMGLAGHKTGGRVGHFDGGGIVPYGAPSGDIAKLPDTTVSIVASPLEMKGGNGPPPGVAPKAPDSASQSPLSSLSQGAGLGKLLSGLSANSGAAPPGIASSGTTDLSNSSPINSITGNSAATEVQNDANFLNNGFVSSPSGISFKKGGIAPHRDSGGMIISPAQAAIAGSSPQTQQQVSQYDNMSIDKLQQLAVMQPNNPLVQRALQQKKMNASGSENIPMNGGYASGGIAGYDDGGYVNDTPAQQVLQDIADSSPPSGGMGPGATDIDTSQISPIGINDVPTPDDAKGIAPPVNVRTAAAQIAAPSENENLDEKPVVDHSGDTIKVHYPSEKTSLDTGMPTYKKDDSVSSSAWEPLLAAGLGMMAGTSPHALVNIGRGGLEGLQAAQAQRKAALDESKQTTMTPYEKEEVRIHDEQLAQGKYVPIKDVFGNVTAIMESKTGRIKPINNLGGQSNMNNISSAIDQPPSPDPQIAASQILADVGSVPTQVMSRQDISGRNAQTKAYNDASLSAKKAIQELNNLDAQTGKYTPGKVGNWIYGGESAVGMGGKGATARTEADKASKNLANAFMQANAGAKGSGIRMVEFDAGAVPNADMTDEARNDLIKKNLAVANSQLQRAQISNMYPRMHMSNVNAIMDNYEEKNPPVLATGQANPNWMKYKDWLAAGRPNTATMDANKDGASQPSGNATPSDLQTAAQAEIARRAALKRQGAP